MWRPVDAIADWIADRLSYRLQMRLAVVALALGFGSFAYMPFSGEPPAIYAMSGAALVFSAASWIAAVEAAQNADQET